MSPPIGQSVKQKVIELYTNGYSSSYDITDELNKQGIKISYGSVLGNLNTYKRNQSNESDQDQLLLFLRCRKKTASSEGNYYYTSSTTTRSSDISYFNFTTCYKYRHAYNFNYWFPVLQQRRRTEARSF